MEGVMDGVPRAWGGGVVEVKQTPHQPLRLPKSPPWNWEIQWDSERRPRDLYPICCILASTVFLSWIHAMVAMAKEVSGGILQLAEKLGAESSELSPNPVIFIDYFAWFICLLSCFILNTARESCSLLPWYRLLQYSGQDASISCLD